MPDPTPANTPPSHPGAQAADQEKTVRMEALGTAGLLRDNAEKLLHQMLSGDMAGLEKEGDVIGPYQLCEMLGEGGFGNVWRAEQTEVVKREVALKVIKLGMDTAQVLGRFNQERQALASLEHPNIATMLDAGVSPNGRPYFAMELVHGGPITDWCNAREMPIPDRLRLFIQICQAVQHAHEKGILHRDLKPTNILVTEVGGEPVPKIIDFGIAKAINASAQELTMLTQADQVIGTPMYMSPEQIEGGRAPDPRSDVYALGVLLYELLTGVLPFDSSTVGQGGLAAVKHLILETVPERPSTRLRRKTGPAPKAKTGFHSRLSTLPADLDWITMRALEKDRLRRYQSAADFAADVQRHLENRPVEARPPSLGYTAGRWMRRHRRAVITATLGAVAATVCIITALHLQSEARKPKPIKLAPGELYTNSLGMKFAPVPGTEVLFCIHETRNQDFAAYAAEVPGAIGLWQTGMERGLDPVVANREEHPAMRLDWDEASAFCTWLSRKEGRVYRLPTDREWSLAAGIGAEEQWDADTTPQSVIKVRDRYPWDGTWPPPPKAGNFSDEARKAWTPAAHTWIADYDDGYSSTAPVMSFPPNKLGLYDMGGNVSEWVADPLEPGSRFRVLRSSSWYAEEGENMSETLLLSHRRTRDHTGTVKAPSFGFRCVMETAVPKADSLPADSGQPPQSKALPKVQLIAEFPAPLPAEEITARAVTNTLGMKFIPVPGTDVLFCVHETRRKDYETFTTQQLSSGSINDAWQRQRKGSQSVGGEGSHPVIAISWDDARAFCAWLSAREQRYYRLPTDREWSIAVGLGPAEAATLEATSPEMLSQVGRKEFPYGVSFPPESEDRAGNYADRSWLAAFPGMPSIAGYDDGYATTAPVMSYKPNPFGLYDLGGNAAEWCEDLLRPGQAERVLRGGSWMNDNSQSLFSAKRDASLPSARSQRHGFRCVLAPGTAPAQLAPVRAEAPAAPSGQDSPPPAAASFPTPLPPEEIAARAITNSLGMKFIPVPGSELLFCIHETRRKDYTAFAAIRESQPAANITWRIQHKNGYPCGAEDDHPAIGMSWEDAQAFCAWLSQQEGRLYRLPTDREWSIAVGLGSTEVEETENTPERLSLRAQRVFPFGLTFPPHTSDRAGNYADTTWQRAFPGLPYILNYDDGYPTTAPVMSYKANPFGLYDLGGNAAEWCEDLLKPGHEARVFRGASWVDENPQNLLSARRLFQPPKVINHRVGFRCVLVPGAAVPTLPGHAASAPTPPPPAKLRHPEAISSKQVLVQPVFPVTLTPAEAGKQAITNSLGMKLLPVPGTNVLFCIHETRYRDYAAYAGAVPGLHDAWMDQSTDGYKITGDTTEHPAVRVSWEDAQNFCSWLSKEEGRIYRLPTDREWSLAAGIGPLEKWEEKSTPQTVFKVQGHYPWGNTWPPPNGAVNYCDDTRRRLAPYPAAKYLLELDDGFAFTAPVMSYKPNALGLYDMGGNVSEWCEDPYDQDGRLFPVRGGAWSTADSNYSQTSFRFPQCYTLRIATNGFRVVLEAEADSPES